MLMERDLAVQTGTMLRDLVGDSLSYDEHTAVESWLAAQLETERSGWKAKLNMAMREIEKERKLALDVHTAIQRINEKIESHPLINGHREPTMYLSAEKDMKVSHIVALDKHVDTMLSLIENAFESGPGVAAKQNKGQRLEDEEDRPSDGASDSVEQMKQTIKQTESNARESELKLTKEIQTLADTIRTQAGLIQELKASKEQEVAELKETVNKMRAQQDKQQQMLAATAAASLLPSNGKQHKSIGVCLRPQVRECCIQTDMDLEEASTKPAGPEREHQQQNGFDLSHASMDPTEKPLIQVTIQNSGYRTMNQSDSVERRPQQTENRSRRPLADLDNIKVNDRVRKLRHQVVSFAQKLGEARWKMDEYQRQMSLIRTNPRCRRNLADGTSGENASGGGLHRKWHSSDGYLCGVRKDILDNSRESMPTSDNKRTKRERNSYGPTSTCFRCHKAYRLKENHRMACRYHPKGKQNIERYDDAGKLVTIVQVWECCMQIGEAVGCTVGEHI